MRIYVAYNGKFGERMIGNMINYRNFCTSCDKLCIFCRDDKTLNFADNITGIYTQPLNLPVYIEEPAKYMPPSLPENDVLLAINLHPDIISEFPGLAKDAGTRLIIAPIEEPDWLSAGLKKQIKEKCEKLGIVFTAPKPFCSLKKGVVSLSCLDELDLSVETGVLFQVTGQKIEPAPYMTAVQ